MKTGPDVRDFSWAIILVVMQFPPIKSQVLSSMQLSKAKLVGGLIPSEGNVMIATDASTSYKWVCDDSFGMVEANNVCQKMGYPRALRFTRQDYFKTMPQQWVPDGWTSMYVLSCNDSFSFSVAESCTVTDNSPDLCTTGEAAGVVCQTDSTELLCSRSDFICERNGLFSGALCIDESRVCNGFLDCSDGSDEKSELCDVDGTIRLESIIPLISLPANSVAGTIYLKFNETWSTICDDTFGQLDAQVICRKLGYSSGLSLPYTASYFGEGEGPIQVDGSGCRGFEASLIHCPKFVWGGDHDCFHHEDAGVLCHAGMLGVQLVDGNGFDSGRVRLTSSSLSLPGEICGTGFDDLDAQVVCRMVGYENVHAVAHKMSPYGKSSGMIWSIVLDCHGHEKSINDCRLKVINDTCSPLETAAVTCTASRSYDDLLRQVLPTDCGVSVNASGQILTNLAKIRGGEIASMFDLPWMAALRARQPGGHLKHICGSVIISEYYLLTAAHCFERFGRLHYIVSVGNFNNNHNDPTQQDHLMERVWVHEGFEELGFSDNDIALIKIKEKGGRGLRFNDRVQPVCLPHPGDYYQNLNSCTVSGWGVIGSIRNTSAFPRTAFIRSMPSEICEEAYGSRLFTSSNVCFGKENLSSSCFGDSGGPLTCVGSNGRRILYGLVNIGFPCHLKFDFPTNDGRVTTHLRWIQETIYRDLGLSD